jgi:putative flippase GtrA
VQQGAGQPVRGSARLLVKELGAFGIVGFLGVLLDVGAFQVLYAHAGLGALTAKLLSTVLSTSMAFLGHRYWSFSHRPRTGLRREYLSFVVVNGATLLLSLGVVAFIRYALGESSALVLQVANIGAIGAGTVIRFLSYRWWIFVAPDHATAAEIRSMTPTEVSIR